MTIPSPILKNLIANWILEFASNEKLNFLVLVATRQETIDLFCGALMNLIFVQDENGTISWKRYEHSDKDIDVYWYDKSTFEPNIKNIFGLSEKEIEKMMKEKPELFNFDFISRNPTIVIIYLKIRYLKMVLK